MFSLGVVLFELSTPFQTTMERLKCITNLREGKMEQVDRLGQTQPAVAGLIARLVDQDPTHRSVTRHGGDTINAYVHKYYRFYSW